MIHQRKHPTFVEDCFGCKAATVSFATVPGARKDSRNGISQIKRRGKGLDAYRERRRAGEQPDGTTLEQIEATDRRVDTFQKLEPELREANAPEVVDSFAKRVANKRR
jgi:hypothetical protein